MSDAAMKRVEEVLLAAVPAYEMYLLQVMGKPFHLKMPLFKTNSERIRVTYESVEQPALGMKKPERLVMWVELNRAMDCLTVSSEYWQDIDELEPTARSEPKVEATPENIMAPAFVFGWLHKLVGGGNEAIEGDSMEGIEEQRMEHAELLIVKADEVLEELGYTIDAESYESYANTLDSFLLTTRLDEQYEGILSKVGHAVRKAAHAYGAAKGAGQGLRARWHDFKHSVKGAYGSSHKKAFDKWSGRGGGDDKPKKAAKDTGDSDSETGAEIRAKAAKGGHEAPKDAGKKGGKLRLVKSGGKRERYPGGKMSDNEYKKRYGSSRKRMAASSDAPDLDSLVDGLRNRYYDDIFNSLNVEELLTLEELVLLMRDEELDESGERFKALTKKLDKGGVSDPKGLAAWIGRKKYGKGKFQKMGKHEDADEPTVDAAVSSYAKLAGLVMPMRGWSLPKLKA